jgi:glycosyltransferase involved in cell wall biosynthesis
MKRIAIFSPQPPYPIVSGLHIRIWENLKVLSKFGRILLIAYKDINAKLDTEIIKEYVDDVLVINVSPENRIKNVLRLLGTVINKTDPFSQLYMNNQWNTLIINKLKLFKPDVSIFESLFLAPLILNLQKHIGKTIVDCHNIESEVQYQLIKLNIDQLYKLRQYIRYKEVKNLERKIYTFTDQIWLVSKRDKMIMDNMIGLKTNKTFVIPNAIDISNYNNLGNTTEYTIAFMGSFLYPPNSQAAEIIIKEIFPKVKKIIKNAKLLFVGAKPTPFMLKAAMKDPDIKITGFVQNINEFLSKASIIIVPLVMGGGTRFKILEALALGKPVISTPKGAEGLELINGQDIIICELNNFSEKIVELIHNPDKINELKETGRKTIQKMYSLDVLHNSIKKALFELEI